MSAPVEHLVFDSSAELVATRRSFETLAFTVAHFALDRLGAVRFADLPILAFAHRSRLPSGRYRGYGARQVLAC